MDAMLHVVEVFCRMPAGAASPPLLEHPSGDAVMRLRSVGFDLGLCTT